MKSLSYATQDLVDISQSHAPPCQMPNPSMCYRSDAVDLDPSYSKAYMRRSAAHEMLDELDSALADARKVRRAMTVVS